MRTTLISLCLLALGCGGRGAAATPPAPTSPAEVREPEHEVGPWGATVPAPETEARVAELLVRMRAGALDASDLDKAVVFGPGLWSTWKLAGLNSDEGIPYMARVPIGDRSVVAHGRAVRFDALPPFMKSDVVTSMAHHFANGEVAPATEAERRLYFTGIAWRIAGEPITVVRKQDETLVVILDGEGRLFILEILSPWYQLLTGGESAVEKYQPAAPSPLP